MIGFAGLGAAGAARDHGRNRCPKGPSSPWRMRYSYWRGRAFVQQLDASFVKSVQQMLVLDDEGREMDTKRNVVEGTRSQKCGTPIHMFFCAT